MALLYRHFANLIKKVAVHRKICRQFGVETGG
jgi:hypothetical protein